MQLPGSTESRELENIGGGLHPANGKQLNKEEKKMQSFTYD